jgi:hypothetical protein
LLFETVAICCCCGRPCCWAISSCQSDHH